MSARPPSRDDSFIPLRPITLPTNIAWLKLSRRFPVYMRIPPLLIKVMLESNTLKSTMFVGGLAVRTPKTACSTGRV